MKGASIIEHWQPTDMASLNTVIIFWILVSLEAAAGEVRQKDCQEVEKLTKKEFLNQYRNIEIIIGSKLDELAKTRERAEKTTQTLSPDKVKSESSGGLEVSIEKIIGLEMEIAKEIESLNIVRIKIEKAISSINDYGLESILRLHYINGMSWEKVAVKMNYSYRHTTRLHGIALQKLKIE